MMVKLFVIIKAIVFYSSPLCYTFYIKNQKEMNLKVSPRISVVLIN